VIDVLARGLAARGHDVRLFTTGDSTCPVPRQHVYAEPPAPMGTTMPELRHALAAYDALRDCDVIHDHTLAGPLVAARHTAGPVVVTTHSVFDEGTTPLYRFAAGYTHVVAISQTQRASAPDVPVAAVIHHGLDLPAYAEGDGEGGFLLFLGRIAPEKGVHRAIDVARLAGLPLVIAAKMREESERRYFDEFVAPRLGPGVEFVGEVSGARKLDLLARARGLLNPICWQEPFGLVMTEALACGTPVLAFPNGAATEIVEDGVTGFLRDDMDALAACAARLDELSRPVCRKSVEERFSAERMVRDYEALYEHLVG
jgi:glycosyltransferase involved in cell wall biosynthesis